jgi:hypothetical protein
MKVEYTDENVTAEIEVERATIGAGLKLMDLQDKSKSIEFEGTRAAVLYDITYLPLVCSAPNGKLTISGADTPWPPSWDVFKRLPLDFTDRWYDAAQKLNPHWFEVPEFDEKKVSDASKES